MPPIAAASEPTIGASNTSFLPSARTVRPAFDAIIAMTVGSKYERWLATTIAGPRFGMCSTP
jgi:hypothetical protein